jgi:hypothetical protein
MVLETNHAADGLTDRKVSSKWNPFWGVLGIGPPRIDEQPAIHGHATNERQRVPTTR